MKKFLILLLLVISSQSSYGQISNANFFTTQDAACPWDTTKLIRSFRDWKVYQTLNGKWDGPIDSSICPTLQNQNRYYVDQFHANSPVFILQEHDFLSATSLSSNLLYSAEASIRSSHFNVINSGLCIGDSCNQLQLNIQIPDSSGNYVKIRSHTYSISNISSFSGENIINMNGCMPSEKFDSSRLVSALIRLNLGSSDSTQYFYPDQLYLFEESSTETISSQNIENFRASSLSYGFPGWYGTYLLVHDDGYPNASNISYTDLTVSPNFPTQETVTLTIPEYIHLSYQPYTEFRGGLTSNSDSIRHHVNIVDNGGDICLSPFVDVRIQGGNSFEYRAGQLSFDGKTACMMFDRNATLRIANGSTLSYGVGGQGMLALKPGMLLDMDDQSELRIHNTVVLLDNDDKDDVGLAMHKRNGVFIWLNKGNKIIFGPEAQIVSKSLSNPEMKLHVIMNGGQIDLSGLSDNDRKRIHLIYPEQKELLSIHDVSFENPVRNYLNVAISSSQFQTVNYQIIDLNGRLITSATQNVNVGISKWNTDVTPLPSGMFLLQISNGNEQIVRKFIKY